MKHHRVEGYRRSRWKNEKGETLEIAIWPPTATMDDFDWRISVALLEEDADFSEFSGIDRSLAIVDGPGIVLQTGRLRTRLDGRAGLFRFAGDVPASAALIAGASADLNVMTRRGGAAHEVSRVAAGQFVRGATGLVALFAQTEVRLLLGGKQHVLERWDMVELGEGETASIVSGEGLEIRIELLGARPTS